MSDTPKIEWTEGVDMAWHLEGDGIVIDRWNVGGEPVPFDQETFDMVWPSWMLDCVKECK